MYDFPKNFTCHNCGKLGHDYKHCPEPTISYGIIAVKIDNNKPAFKIDIDENINYDGSGDGIDITSCCNITVNTIDDVKKFGKYINNIYFLLISRRHSLGYSEFIRGHYEPGNAVGIIFLFEQMMNYEIEELKKEKTFEEFWSEFWFDTNKKDEKLKRKSEIEFEKSKENFMKLKKNDDINIIPLSYYVSHIKSKYVIPEWGFPKGRRLREESDIECAKREFVEETGFTYSDIEILTNVKPIVENITGTDGINYRHIYYLAKIISDKNPVVDENNITQKKEIGNIGLFKYADAMALIRDYHIDKKNIILNVTYYIINSLTN